MFFEIKIHCYEDKIGFMEWKFHSSKMTVEMKFAKIQIYSHQD